MTLFNKAICTQVYNIQQMNWQSSNKYICACNKSLSSDEGLRGRNVLNYSESLCKCFSITTY